MNPYQKDFEAMLKKHSSDKAVGYNFDLEDRDIRDKVSASKGFQLNITCGANAREASKATGILTRFDCCGIIEISKLHIYANNGYGLAELAGDAQLDAYTKFWKFLLWELRHGNDFGFGIWTREGSGRTGYYGVVEDALVKSKVRVRTNQPWTNPNSGNKLITRTIDLASFK